MQELMRRQKRKKKKGNKLCQYVYRTDLPVKEILEHENIFDMDEYRAAHQDIRTDQDRAF